MAIIQQDTKVSALLEGVEVSVLFHFLGCEMNLSRIVVETLICICCSKLVPSSERQWFAWLTQVRESRHDQSNKWRFGNVQIWCYKEWYDVLCDPIVDMQTTASPILSLVELATQSLSPMQYRPDRHHEMHCTIAM